MTRIRFDLLIQNAIRDLPRRGDHLIAMTDGLGPTTAPVPAPDQGARGLSNDFCGFCYDHSNQL